MRDFKTFQIDVPVLIADGVTEVDGRTYRIEDVFVPSKTMPVFYAFDLKNVIGVADLRREGVKVMAKITMRADGSPVARLWPSVAGLAARGALQICGVNLAPRPNPDRRIDSVKWPSHVEQARI